MKTIDFLIAGVQKGGTTALHNYLKQNPNVFLPERKELHFFDNETLDWQQPVYQNYHDFFKTARPNQSLGEATPIYTFWPNSLARIMKYNKDMKLIICLRNPTERAYSHWRMETSREKEDLSFSQAIRNGRSRITNENAKRTYTYVERGFYADQIEQAIDFFSAKNIHIVQQDNLLKFHNAVLKNICHFLKIPHFELPHSFVRPIKNNETLPVISKVDSNYLNEIYTDDQVKTNKLIKHINSLTMKA